MKQRILLAVALWLVPIARAQVYTVTDMGQVLPTSINAWGQVVGSVNGHAFLWTQFGGLKNLGTLPGGTFSSAAAINDLGVLVGVADGPGTITWPDGTTQNCTDLIQPFAWTRPTGMKGLGSPGVMPVDFFSPGGPTSAACTLFTYANDINIRDQIVGGNQDFATYKFGFLWNISTGMTQFTGAFQTATNAINDVGQIAGQISDERLALVSHAALWNNGLLTDLGTLGGDSSNWSFCSGADGINDFGGVVGWSTLPDSAFCFDYILSPVHAFLWKAGVGMQDLGTLPGDASSVAEKINFFGEVIGSSGNTIVWKNGEEGGLIQVIGRPFVWSKQRGMQDLNTLISTNSDWVLDSVTGINIWGQIVGSGTLNGQPHGFLLTPTVLP